MYFVYDEIEYEGISSYFFHRTEMGALRKLLELVSEINERWIWQGQVQWEITQTDDMTTYSYDGGSVVMKKITVEE